MHFVDDIFFVNPERATKIICEIHKKWPNIVFSFATRSDQLLRGLKFLQVLKDNNCVSIEIGIENGSQSVLDRYGKGVSVNTNKEAIMLLREIGMDVGIDYILFDYKTTLNELEENIQFFKETSLWGSFPSLVYSSLVLYPGTPSADKWLENDKNFIYYDRPTFCKFENEVVGKIFEFMSFFAKKRELIFDLLNIVAERGKSEKSKK